MSKSESELVSAVCRRNTVDDATIPKYTPLISRENLQLFYFLAKSSSSIN